MNAWSHLKITREKITTKLLRRSFYHKDTDDHLVPQCSYFFFPYKYLELKIEKYMMKKCCYLEESNAIES